MREKKEAVRGREKSQQSKYIGETSRSGYERMREHVRDFNNLSKKSHILKHYLECHKDVTTEKM